MAADSLPAGRWAEQLACRWLEHKGLRLVIQNFHSKRGEIDLIMMHGPILVFVEVRYRSGISHGEAIETIDWRKQNRILATAEYYLHRHPRYANCVCRFDAVVVSGTQEQPVLEWIDDAFRA